MYRLTPRMLQRFRQDLAKYHELFTAGRCQGWEQEELIVNAIKSDTQAQHHVKWREAGHDDKADVRVRTNGEYHEIQVKSGQVKPVKELLVFSGHRLGRFDGDLEKITEYLNGNKANIISVSYSKKDDDKGRHHIYCLRYVDIRILTGISQDKWEKAGKQYQQTNSEGILFSLRPSMSWQIWWEIPLGLTEEAEEFEA